MQHVLLVFFITWNSLGRRHFTAMNFPEYQIPAWGNFFPETPQHHIPFGFAFSVCLISLNAHFQQWSVVFLPLCLFSSIFGSQTHRNKLFIHIIGSCQACLVFSAGFISSLICSFSLKPNPHSSFHAPLFIDNHPYLCHSDPFVCACPCKMCVV